MKLEYIINNYFLQIAEDESIEEKEKSYQIMLEEIISLKEKKGIKVENAGDLFNETSLRLDIDILAFMYKKLPDFIKFLEDNCIIKIDENAFQYLMKSQLWTDREESNNTFITLCEKYNDYTLPLNIVHESLIGISPFFAEYDPSVSIYEGDGLLFEKEFLLKNKKPFYDFNIHDNLTLIKYVVEKYNFDLEDYAANNATTDLFSKSVFETTCEYLLSKGATLKNEMEEYSDKMPEILRNVYLMKEKEKLISLLDENNTKTPNKRL